MPTVTDTPDARADALRLQQLNERLELATRAADLGIWEWDSATRRSVWDQRTLEMYGLTAEQFSGTLDCWIARIHPEDRTTAVAKVQSAMASGSSFEHEFRILRANDGAERVLQSRAVVQRNPAGEVLRITGAERDITAERAAIRHTQALNERLRKTEQLANEVSRLAQIGAWEIDLVSSRVLWTEGTRLIHGVDAAFQPTLESLSRFFPADALAAFQAALRAVTPDAPSFDLEVQLITADLRTIWARILGRGEFERGVAVSVRGAIQDVTSRHHNEEARRSLEAQLFQAQKMETLGTLAGGIAHDFNNLLTGIIGYHELAADSIPEDHPARMCLNEARKASLRARELVEQILTFGRHSGAGEHAPLDLATVVEEARRFLRATLPANITIETQAAEHCGMVLADATQIHQVLLNLGSNAAHAMKQNGGVLRITLEPAEVSPDLALTLGGPAANSYVRLSVSDTGHGMDESTRRRIFDPFFTTKNTREGTGLGLAVVHGIVRSHRGAIDVESALGRGSTFHIYLPTADEGNPERTDAKAVAPRGDGEFICVVDDEEVVGSCTKLVLESRGYQTLIFASAEACLAELQAAPHRCSVLITDQTMPGMQGTELAAAMRRLVPTLPVVIMSGYFSKISPQALDELGQVELLAKPFTTDELSHAVHRALNQSGRNP